MNGFTENIDCSFFKENRNKLAIKLPPQSIAIVTANDIFPANGDGTLPYKPSSDLFYLTGIVQEQTLLLLFPSHPEPKFREILFIRFSDEHTITWEGKKLSMQEAQAISGIHTIFWTHEFETIFHQLVYEARTIFIATNEHVRNTLFLNTSPIRLLDSLKQKYPLHQYDRLSPLLTELRIKKSETEIKLIRKAIHITQKAFLRVLRTCSPNKKEYEIEAEIIHEFISNGSRGHAFSPIIAGGENACILHYKDNNKVLKDGELLLVDFGAEYACYNADVTRTIPISGKFNNRQKDVYNAVLRIQKFAISLLKPGCSFCSYENEVLRKVEEELLYLGLLKKHEISSDKEQKNFYKKYFMHGVSHFLGLDVHDVGHKHTHFEPNMVLTVEPGIYIKEEKLGVRLENNILITDSHPIDLTADIPIEAEEIENLMNA
jgi:Xaa-Pro aminopeptidase